MRDCQQRRGRAEHAGAFSRRAWQRRGERFGDDLGTFFKDDDFEFMMLMALGATYYKGADVGECLSTAASIEDSDYEGWYRAWRTTADRVRGIAERSATEGHQASARDAFLRASTYYNTAAFFLDGTSDSSRLLPTWKAHRECFDEAASRFDPPF